MNSDLRAILALIAVGRISPREAERLLALLPNEDDVILRAAVCLAVVWLLLPHLRGFLAGVNHVFVSWFPGIALTAHHALTCFTHRFGGL